VLDCWSRVTRGANLRFKVQRSRSLWTKIWKSFLLLSLWKVEWFTSNQAQNDHQNIVRILSDTFHQQKCFVFAIFVIIQEGLMLQRQPGHAFTCYCNVLQPMWSEKAVYSHAVCGSLHWLVSSLDQFLPVILLYCLYFWLVLPVLWVEICGTSDTTPVLRNSVLARTFRYWRWYWHFCPWPSRIWWSLHEHAYSTSPAVLARTAGDGRRDTDDRSSRGIMVWEGYCVCEV